MTLYLLNLADLLFTLHAISHGGVELNPLMRCIPFMVFFKVVVVGVLCWWLGTINEPIAHWGLRICTVAYVAVNIWHFYNIF